MNTKRQKIRRIVIFISFLMFPATFYYFSPYIILFTSQAGIINGSFIIFIILFLISLFFGRLWCAWACPVAGLQDVCFKSQKRRPSLKVNIIKYFIWIIWVGFIAWLAISAGGYKKVDFFNQTRYGISVTDAHSLTMFTTVMVVILIIIFIFGKRGFCHSTCWIAPFMVIGRKISLWLKLPKLSLIAEKEKCNSCKLCTRNCPQCLEVHEMVQLGKMENSECILCATCIDSCNKKAISYIFSNNKY